MVVGTLLCGIDSIWLSIIKSLMALYFYTILCIHILSSFPSIASYKLAGCIGNVVHICTQVSICGRYVACWCSCKQHIMNIEAFMGGSLGKSPWLLSSYGIFHATLTTLFAQNGRHLHNHQPNTKHVIVAYSGITELGFSRMCMYCRIIFCY